MVEYPINLDLIFASLSDTTRRDILKLVSVQSLSVSEIASYYNLTFAAISKHLKVLEKARLIVKVRSGREQIVRIAPGTLEFAESYLDMYRQLWESQIDSPEQYLHRRTT